MVLDTAGQSFSRSSALGAPCFLSSEAFQPPIQETCRLYPATDSNLHPQRRGSVPGQAVEMVEMRIQHILVLAAIQVHEVRDAGFIHCARSSGRGRLSQPPPNSSPRWLCASKAGKRGLLTRVTLVTSFDWGGSLQDSRYFIRLEISNSEQNRGEKSPPVNGSSPLDGNYLKTFSVQSFDEIF